MILEWFNSRQATQIGVALADQFALRTKSDSPRREEEKGSQGAPGKALQEIFLRANREVRSLELNFYQKAKFANSFKWRLLENGVEKELADEVTHALVLHLSGDLAASSLSNDPGAVSTDRPYVGKAKDLLAEGNRCIARGAYTEAITLYQDLIRVDPRHATGLNNMGAALSKLGRYKEAEIHFFRAIQIEPNYPDPHSNIGTALLLKGLYADAEKFTRRALKLNPRFVDARINLGLILVFLNRLREAKAQFEKVLKYQPRNTDALLGMAMASKIEGSFDEAGTMLSHALEVNPKMPKALAAQASMRKMTSSDKAWLETAENVAASGIGPLDESELRFAIGKYYDDIQSFKLSFQNYKRANDLLKSIAEPYDRDGYEHFVDLLIRAHPQGVVADGWIKGASASSKPIFVVGMPRSGTSLVEQIISSHPAARGAGELEFWSNAVDAHEAEMESGLLDEQTRSQLAANYLRILESRVGDALRVVDKAPVNSDYLGIIHSVFPNARFIYMRRDPIDTCLSCYFQKFVLSLNFTMDLSDLAHYYRQHQRLITHWHAVLPPGTILDVPYEGLVADQESWSRRILDFIGLEWDERVLDFHKTHRPVATASFWQVRQKIYNHSVQRWRNYAKYIGPLLPLNDLTR